MPTNDDSDRSGSEPLNELVAPTLELPSAQTERLVRVLDQYLEELKAGQPPDRDRLLAEHPDLAPQLEACLAGMEFIHAAPAELRAAPKVLGDFRILREVGRGGMGAVYEAEQMSLGRRVALKILRFGAVSDPEAVERFQREAQTVAALHHTNIVPIFSVGSEDGVNYYAMQFIDGRGLDEVAQGRDAPLDSRTVAQWGLQAAEALAHAHDRDVVHRDVKPSNLLLDQRGQIWLTDFGLAKRLDDVTLSMTGALLGTPRYMSPEQASATTKRIDHRTDIYSLGATLYELATGQPVFGAETPHGIISQILADEPAAPRRVRPDLPRDLETILLKCLAKDTGGRYQSAGQLADDLRAFLDGRPIAARRASVVEHAVRWVRRQRRSVALTAAAAGATLLLVLLIAAGGLFWHRSRLSFVKLTTDHPPLVAQLLRDGQPSGPPVTVPTQEPVKTPAGEYQLQVSGEGRLSQVYDVRLEAGETLDHKLDLEDQLLWGDLQLGRTFRLAVVSENGEAPASAAGGAAARTSTDVIVLDNDGIHSRRGIDGKPRWSLNLQEPSSKLLTDGVNLAWPWDLSSTASYQRGLEMFDARPHVVASPGWDADNDGTTDLVLAARHQPWLVAVSGADGQPLWVAARGDAKGPRAALNRYTEGSGTIPYEPLMVGNQDDDQVADLLVLFVHVPQRQGTAERWIELISGKTGAMIWRLDLAEERFQLNQGEEVPYALRWFYGSSSGMSSGGSSSHARYQIRGPSNLKRTGTHHYLPSRPHLVDDAAADRSASAEQPCIMFVAGKGVMRIDLRTGQVLKQQDTGIASIEPRYADFDGDGEIDMLLTDKLPDKVVPPARRGPPQNVAQARLTAWSLASGAVLWQCTVDAQMPRQEDVAIEAAQWPLVADLDGDGAAEVMAPDGHSLDPWQGPPWGRIVVLEGKSGKPLWRRQLFNADMQLDFFVVGPDIDGDGSRELYVAALWGSEWSLFVDCLSGSDGRTLWRAEEELVSRDQQHGSLRLSPPTWRRQGADGWPQLIVPARVVEGDIVDRTCFISAGTGRVTHVALGVADAQPANLDGDDAEDLVLFQRSEQNWWDHGGVVAAVRGAGQEAWRRVEQQEIVVGDLDGDGVRDVAQQERRTVVARSGASGRQLWERAAALGSRRGDLTLLAATQHDPRHDLLPAHHDLDGDSTSDLLAYWTGDLPDVGPFVAALSGSSGRTLWQAELVARAVFSMPLIDSRDLDGDGQAEVVLAVDYAGQRTSPRRLASQDSLLRLVVLSGRDGAVRWSQPLMEEVATGGQRAFRTERAWLEAAYADLDGDRVLDIVLPAQKTGAADRLEMRAVSGADGRTLWQFDLPPQTNVGQMFGNAPPAAAGDLDHDGRPEVVVLALDQEQREDVARVTVLDGRTGQPKWRWHTPVLRYACEIDGDRQRVKNRIRPLLVRRSGGEHWIAVLVRNKTNELHVLDAAGRLVASDVHSEQSGFGVGLRLWTLDVDGDGGDELLSVREDSLMAVRPDDLSHPLWRRPPGRDVVNMVVGILPDSSAPGQIVAVGGPGDNSLRGIDAATGEIVWRCVGPGPADKAAQWLYGIDIELLSAPSNQAAPAALFQYDGLNVLRRGIPVRKLAWAERAPSVVQPAEYDPRLLRPLPWKPDSHELGGAPRLVFWGGLYGVTLLAAPIALAVWMVRRRRWGMNILLLAPAVVGVALAVLLLAGPDEISISQKLVTAVAAAPVLFTLMLLAVWLRQGRRRHVLVWLAVGAAATLAMIAVVLGVIAPLEGTSLQEGERYSWSGWYWMFIPVLYVLAWGTLIVAAGWWLIRAVVRWGMRSWVKQGRAA